MAKPTRVGKKWRIRWMDWQGMRRTQMFTRHEDALYALQRHTVESEDIQRGLKSPPTEKHIFAELAALWNSSQGVRKRSGKFDECILRVHLVPFFGTLSLGSISQLHCDQYLDSKARLSTKTLHNHLTLLIACLNHAKRIGWLAQTPEIKKPRIEESDISFLRTEDEERRLLRAARAEALQAYYLYAVALYTGMRAGELAGLSWDDIDLPNRRIVVQRSFDGPTKSGRVRRVPILDVLLPILQEMKSLALSNSVFTNEAGGKHQPSARIFQEIFQRVLKCAGFETGTLKGTRKNELTFHSLRHTFASRWVSKGGDIYKLQSILGHSTLKMTQRYAHFAPGAFAEEMDRFAAAEILNVVPFERKSEFHNDYRKTDSASYSENRR